MGPAGRRARRDRFFYQHNPEGDTWGHMSWGHATCLVAFYTGHGHDRQTQNLAVSVDSGRTWRKHAGNLPGGDRRRIWMGWLSNWDYAVDPA